MHQSISRRTIIQSTILFLFLLLGCSRDYTFKENQITIKNVRLHAVRFDPSYYYETDLTAEELCRSLAENWKNSGITLVYIKVYDPQYGAVYATDHPFNIETDYGRLDLLQHIIDACHTEQIQVYAWIPAFQHKQVWESHPEWRVKRPDGTDYRTAQDAYPLCTRSAAFQNWWLGFVEEILTRYPALDGIDIGEPVVSWHEGRGCYCDSCRTAYSHGSGNELSESFQQIRSEPLTQIIHATSRLVHEAGKSVSVTTVVTPAADGRIHSAARQKRITGFDLDGVLDSTDRPDLLNIELIWQQHSSAFGDTLTFTPEGWTYRATRDILRQIHERARTVVHVELTEFGEVRVTTSAFEACVKGALDAGAGGIDFYDSHQADIRHIWPEIREALAYMPQKKVAVFYDPEGLNDARQLDVLLRHFHTDVRLIPVEETFSPPRQFDPDYIFYLGVTPRHRLPATFLDYLTGDSAPVCWLNANLNLLAPASLDRFGFACERTGQIPGEVTYKEQSFPRIDSTLNIITVTDSAHCEVLASVHTGQTSIPYIVKSDRFWYVADLPTAYVIEGGRQIVFADLLHDIIGEEHESSHTALVRIEDVNPLSDPESLRRIANFLAGEHIPFAVGFTPFYLDPSTNTSVDLADVPDLVEAMRHMISKGATIVLHGCTHQYRGQTTVDYEFWDGINEGPLFEDSKEYVIERIKKALKACMDAGIYPQIWETPHYAASQRDYAVIDGIFNTVYERRQTIDLLGSDQLLPFYIPARHGHSRMIPENLGYVPTSNPTATQVTAYAKRNLAVRDGFASFFFHPFIPLQVLKDLVHNIKDLGYTFGDVQQLGCTVNTDDAAIISSGTQGSIQLTNQYREEIVLAPGGRVSSRTVSDTLLSGRFTRTANYPPRWIYAFRGLTERPPAFTAKIWNLVERSPLKFDRLTRLPALTAENSPAIPVILINPAAGDDEARSQRGFLEALSAVGIDYTTVDVETFLDLPAMTNILIVPRAAARLLSEQQTLFIVGAVSRGLSVILEKNSDLSQRLGITAAGPVLPVERVQDGYYPSVKMIWKKPGNYRRFEVAGNFEAFYTAEESGDPLVAGSYYGDGKILYFATLFDPITDEGYGRYPFFIDLLQRHFELWPLARSETAEVYFEPGDREDVSIEDLVKLWKQHGFQKIYIAGWHVYPDWTYDYGRVIELAHENGMLVYLWLELPHVNQKFWDEHPEWREITATGREAIVDWRRLMALSDESCRQAVLTELDSLISRFDWDGINLAELYFESALGPESPDTFTPMHRSVREQFRKQAGFDPMLLFDSGSRHYWKRNSTDYGAFQTYRKKLVVDLHRIFLTFLHQEAEKKDRDMEIVVTAIDNIHAVETGENTASDTRALLKLRDEVPFVLQIEDPQELWHLGPFRYRNLSNTYRPLVPLDNLILDINIVPYREWDISLAPTQQPTGLELSQLIRSAQQQDNRVALYSESSIYDVDLPWVSYTLANHCHEELHPHQWRIDSPRKVLLNLDKDSHKNIKVNGKIWPAYYKGKTILPGDSLVLEPLRPIETIHQVFTSSTRIVDISGELKDCRLTARGVDVSYSSDVINYVVINESPRTILLDGEPVRPEITHGLPGYSISLPAGEHQVQIFTATRIGLFLKNFSIVVSALIVLISTVGGGSLLIIYLTRSRRRRKNKKRSSATTGE